MDDDQDLPGRIAAAAFPLRTTAPDDGDRSDLEGLKQCLDGRSVVALGESTHGAREIARVKHRLVEFLVTELDVRGLGLEMGFTETLPLDEYVRRGDGNPREILADFGWLARTESFLALVEWLRDYNEDRSRSEQVAVYGFDIGSGTASIEAVESYLQRVDPAFCDVKREQFETLRTFGDWDDDRCDELTAEAEAFESLLRERFDDRAEEYVAATSRAAWTRTRHQVGVYASAREYARLVDGEQWVRAREHRDRSMADTVEWTLQNLGVNRTALWAHDGHVRKGRVSTTMPDPARTMGWYLDQRLGAGYYALGVEFGRGTFQAAPNPDRGDADGLQAWEIEEPRPGSTPSILRRVPEDVFILDLERATEDDCLREWLDEEKEVLSVGGYFFENDLERHYDASDLSQEFDGLLFVDEISRARPLTD